MLILNFELRFQICSWGGGGDGWAVAGGGGGASQISMLLPLRLSLLIHRRPTRLRGSSEAPNFIEKYISITYCISILSNFIDF